MGTAISTISRGRILRQQIPLAPPTYDQTYISQLAAMVNDYMVQATAPGDVTGARFICSDPIIVGPSSDPNAAMQDTSTLPTGMFYLMAVPGATPGTYFLTVVMTTDPGTP